MTSANHLINESSPYLQQHAHNPVNWYPWGKDALQRAVDEDKPLIISIGYSSCHWCHVMEEESFEDEQVAGIMNEHFISIKVDREERPDIDSYYMNALQMVTGQGGWPLNMIALPDGRPFYGGTYFPKENWISLLNQVAEQYQVNREAIKNAALSIEKGIESSLLGLTGGEASAYTLDELKAALDAIRSRFDHQWGGIQGAPKFPMPVAYHFLLAWSTLMEDSALQDFVVLTLDRMASGGIYDQIGGGFSRYSTDVRWKVPHFEKMLYDNAQLVSLYSDAYKVTGKERYREVISQTLNFIDERMTSPDGLFYSALDADSQGEEGLYYTWEDAELREILGADYPAAREYFGIQGEGAWEKGRNILLALPDKDGKGPGKKTLNRICASLKEVRDKRIPPGLDDKSLTSWNALMIRAYTDAYRALGNSLYLKQAVRAADFILKHFRTPDGGLFHSYRNGQAHIDGFLEDYAHLVRAMISLFELKGDQKYLTEARYWCDYALKRFGGEEGQFLFASSRRDGAVQRDVEIADITIPSSNAVMAHNLFQLAKLTGSSLYEKLSKELAGRISRRVLDNSFYFSHWAELMLYQSKPYYEVVFVGPKAESFSREMGRFYLPNALFAFSLEREDSLALFKGRFKKGETLIYICRNNSCGLPVKTVKEALDQIVKRKKESRL